MKNTLVVATAVSLLFASWSPGHAASKPFYEGKVIKFIVPTKPGGGYDFYARIIGRYMEKELKGSTVIVRNIPGAGHLIGTNEIYHAKPDGLTFGVFNPGVITAQLIGQKGVTFDVAEMSWIGATGIASYAFVVDPRKFKTLEEVRRAERVTLSTAGLSSLSNVIPSLFKEISGFDNLKLLTGYGGTEGEMAMIRGDIDGQFASWNSMTSFVEDGNAVPVMFVGTPPKGFEAVPSMNDVVTDEKYLPMKNFMNAISSYLNRPFAGPPGIPPDRIKVLRDAFRKVVHDPEFEAAMQAARRPTGYLSAEECQGMVKSFRKMDSSMIDTIKRAYGVK